MRHAGLLAPVLGCLTFFAVSDACAQAQAPVPGKEASPFDWLRHDAPVVNRPGGPTSNPSPEGPGEQKLPETAQPVVEETIPIVSEVAPTEPVVPIASSAPVAPLEEAPTAPTPSVPSPVSRPLAAAVSHPEARGKAAAQPTPAPTEQIAVVNKRSVTLNELKLVSLKNSRKPFIVRPSLKGGESLTIDIPKDWGCTFLVWTQFSEEPSEQYDGVDLCADKTINLVN